jgi:hypothetical protein
MREGWLIRSMHTTRRCRQVYILMLLCLPAAEAASERQRASLAQKQARKAQRQAAAAQDEVTALRQQLEALQSQLQQSQDSQGTGASQ